MLAWEIALWTTDQPSTFVQFFVKLFSGRFFFLIIGSRSEEMAFCPTDGSMSPTRGSSLSVGRWQTEKKHHAAVGC